MKRYYVVLTSTCKRAHRALTRIEGDKTVCGLTLRTQAGWRVLFSGRGEIQQCSRCYK